ncbi:MAG TPA: S1C family serine protease [Propionicimonas sp.]|uniref:S1C family serine protease n=1 Tax=Propionicimonas sp. TaxID=1955623 RepID=UPI002F421E6F
MTAVSTPSPSPTPIPDLAGALQRSTPSVGLVVTSYCAELPSTGTGFMVGDGLVLTAAHVAAGASAMQIVFPGKDPADLEVIDYDEGQDTALLRLVDDDLDLSPLTLAPADARTGQQVGVLGYPLGYTAIHVNSGIVSSVDDDVSTEAGSIENVMTLDAAVNPGNSGGPVINAGGEVVGLISGSAIADVETGATAEGIHFAIPVNRLRSFVDEWSGTESDAFGECEGEYDEDPDSPLLEMQMRSDDEDADELGAILWQHGEAINQSNYDAAWDLFTPAMKRRMGGLSQWSSKLQSTLWLVLEIRDVARDGDRAVVRTFVRTHQEADRGPGGMTCTIWPLTYHLSLVGEDWLIDRAILRTRKPLACSG